MGTDSSELTFVRCPSCRSLVPAVSTRCRMCGAGLESSGAGTDEGAGEAKSGRVRQRTVSTQNNKDFAAVRDRLRLPEDAEGSEDEPEKLFAALDQEEAEDDLLAADDPLGAFLEEVELAEDEAEADSWSEPTPAEPSLEAFPPKATRPEDFKPHPSPDPSPPAVATEELDEDEAGWDEGESSADEAGAVREDQLDELFTEAAESELEDYEVAELQEPEPSPVAPVAAPVSPHLETVRPTPVARTQEAPQQELEAEEDWDEEDDWEAPEEESREPVQPEAPPRVSTRDVVKAPAATTAPVTGRLFGWLVSYMRSEGEAIEIREGKFFVSASSLKDRDLVIKDPSVSTPHAMVSVNAGSSGLQVQDLLSERGVFVRKQGFDTYQRHDNVIELENGDWVRFGDVEFVVVLVPHVGVK